MSETGRLDWLVARPIAHRGLHDGSGVIENSASAVARAADLGFSVEIDVQITADGAAVVFHDDRLERLTAYKGPVAARSASELLDIPLLNSTANDQIWSLEKCLSVIASRVPLIVEIKSLWNGDTTLAERVGRTLAAYSGYAAAKSFDPDMVAALQRTAPFIPRGIIGCAFAAEEWPFLSWNQRWRLSHLAHWKTTKPDFISWNVHDLPNLAVTTAHSMAGAPVMGWTIRTPEDQAHAAIHADQMIFEGFLP
jgi:glycerophosphoryl diester phosphodiesterase